MTAQLSVKCQEHLDAVLLFAAATHQRPQLEEQLDRLIDCLPDGWSVELYSDFAPYSFAWTEFDPTHRRCLNGGLIYHGSHDGGGNGGAPSFSVCLTPTSGWSIHT